MLSDNSTPLKALLSHLFKVGKKRDDCGQRELFDLLQTTIQQTLVAEADEYRIALKVITDIVSLSTTPDSLKVKLQKALDHLLSIPNVDSLDSGCLFLVDEENGKLNMVAHSNFSPEQINLCRNIDFGSCLCGLAMDMEHTYLFRPEIDENHINRLDDSKPHGHSIFKVKAMNSEKIIMVVNIIIRDRCKENPHSKLLVDSISMALSVLHTLHTNNERKQKRAIEDKLTGIPNRRLFIDRLEQVIYKSRRSKEAIAVMALGVDRFSRINDTMGRTGGDAVLKTLATRLAGVLRGGDTLAKADGDEFLLLCSIQNTSEIMHPLRRIQDAMAKPIQVDGRFLQVQLSIGISLFPDDGDQLLEKAMFALKSAKKKGGGEYQLFSKEAHLQNQNLLDLEHDLRNALNQGDLVAYYQPKIALSTMKIVGFEALVRWLDPADPGHMVAFPDQFIPLAEETGLILPLGQHILESACLDLKRWLDMGYENLHVAVNLSPRQFSDPKLVDVVVGSLQRTGLPPHCLELEITESQVMTDAQRAKEVLVSLKALGVKISLDDFGTGYSSLSHLQQFPFDRLKIDRSFITSLQSKPDKSNIVFAIINMARSLNLMVTAEGVETADQQCRLFEGGCDDVQGWLHGRAQPAEMIPRLLNKFNN
ncbi:MAG: bifunctional diguanylate cyclase/phosphodiesterase [Magnetococcales bacterium]|nr:bifunctional diguanylate cyclase/phosphodiesterase [Magnetococcales bacterium]